MKTLNNTLAALVCAASLMSAPAFAADPVQIAPRAVVVKTPIEVVVPVAVYAEPPRAVVVERITMYSLLQGGWTPVSAAIIPDTGIPGTNGAFAHVSHASAMRLYKNGVYADCGIAQVGGIYNDCRIVTTGTR